MVYQCVVYGSLCPIMLIDSAILRNVPSLLFVHNYTLLHNSAGTLHFATLLMP